MSYDTKETQLLAALKTRCDSAGVDWASFKASRDAFITQVLEAKQPPASEEALTVWQRYEALLRQLYPQQILDPLLLPISLLKPAGSKGRKRAARKPASGGGADSDASDDTDYDEPYGPGDDGLASARVRKELMSAIRTAQKRFIVWQPDQGPAAAGPAAAGGVPVHLHASHWSQMLDSVWSDTMLPALCGHQPLPAVPKPAPPGASQAAAAAMVGAAAAAASSAPKSALKYDNLLENEADVHGVSANIHTTTWEKGRVEKEQLEEEELVAQVGGGEVVVGVAGVGVWLLAAGGAGGG